METIITGASANKCEQTNAEVGRAIALELAKWPGAPHGQVDSESDSSWDHHDDVAGSLGGHVKIMSGESESESELDFEWLTDHHDDSSSVCLL